MKKLIATILTLAMTLLLLASCTPSDNQENGGNNDTVTVRIGYMSGPTGMGMAKLINDNGGKDGNDKYAFNSYADTADAKADLTKGDVDIICLPTNEAAAYCKTVDSSVRVLAINCLNSLFLISDKDNDVTSLNELEGKTVYTCKNGTPKIILEYIIKKLSLNITVSTTTPDGTKEMVTPADVQAQVVNGALPFAVIPEPLITSAKLAINNAGKADEISYSVDVDLGEAYESIEGNPPVAMGCIVTTQKFIDDNPDELSAFLDEYKASVNFIGDLDNLDTSATYIANAGIMGAVPAAKSALSNLGDAISYVDGAEMKTTLKTFYAELALPAPDDTFYYEK